MMPIVRVSHDKENPYVVMNKTGLDDPRLSFKAKGLLAYLLSKPDHWEVYVSHLAKQSKDGKGAVRSGLKELRECGYVTFARTKTKQGKFYDGCYTVYEKPHHGFPYVDNPNEDNCTLVSNDLLVSNDNSKDAPQEEKEEQEPAPDFLGDVVKHTKKKEQEPWKEELPKGWEKATEDRWRICQRVALLWRNSKVAYFVDDIRDSLDAADYLLDLHNNDLRATLFTIDRYHAATEEEGLTIAGPYSLRNVIPAFMAKNGIGANGKTAMKVGR